MPSTRRAGALLAALVLPFGGACTASERGATPSPSGSVSPSPTPTPAPSSPSPSPSTACPDRYREPDPDRPVVQLDLAVAGDHRTVRGTERVVFRPDLAVGEVVFRLWPNGPRSAAAGGRTTVTSMLVTAPGGVRATRFALGSDRTLLRVPLGRRLAAGTPITAVVGFTVTLPTDANERFGHDGRTVWLASGHPMLAWERGRGWATEPGTAAFAEASTSEVFRLERLTVDAAAGEVVLATGAARPAASASGRARTKHAFAADAVRDVMVAAGPFRVARATGPGNVPVRVGVAPGLGDDPAQVARLTVAAMGVHGARFGPFPYRTLDVAVIPDLRGGIEYPAGILLGTRQLDTTLTHEVAHEWFYGLVGDNQGRDPWLDESFATYAEALHLGSGDRYLRTSVPAYGRRRVGRPMSYWERNRDTYFRSVYIQGAAMLLRARAAAGAARWDRALRCFVADAAHRVATPADLARALSGLPAALRVLREYGALPPP